MTRARAIDELGRLIADREVCAILSRDATAALAYARNVLLLQESADRAEMEKRDGD